MVENLTSTSGFSYWEGSPRRDLIFNALLVFYGFSLFFIYFLQPGFAFLIFFTAVFLLEAPHFFSTYGLVVYDPIRRAVFKKYAWMHPVCFLISPAAFFFLVFIHREELFTFYSTLVFTLAYWHSVNQSCALGLVYKSKASPMLPGEKSAYSRSFRALYYGAFCYFYFFVVKLDPFVNTAFVQKMRSLASLVHLDWISLGIAGLGAVGFAYQEIKYRLLRGRGSSGLFWLHFSVWSGLHLPFLFLPALGGAISTMFAVSYISSMHALQYHFIALQFSKAHFSGLPKVPFPFRKAAFYFLVFGSFGVADHLSFGLLRRLDRPLLTAHWGDFFSFVVHGFAIHHIALDSVIWSFKKDPRLAVSFGLTKRAEKNS